MSSPPLPSDVFSTPHPISGSSPENRCTIIRSHMLSSSFSRSSIPAERTPLLSVLPSSFPRGTAGVIVQQAFPVYTGNNEETYVLEEEAGGRSAPALTQIGTIGLSSEVNPMPVVHATSISSESSSSLSSLASVDLKRDDGLIKIADEETPLIPKTSYGKESEVRNCRFLIPMSERQFRVILIGILTVNFVGAFDSTIMASTHPSVTSTFKSSNSASWLSTSFLLTSTCFQPLFGRLADIFGRRLPFAVSLFLFSFGTVWCALSQSVGSFIAARAVCGVGCGGIWTMGAVVLSDIIPIELRGTYQSWNNLGYGMGSMMGAALGGFMADTIGWRWVFGVQMPPALICTAIISLTIPEPPDSPHKQTSFSAPSRSQTPRARPRKLKKFDLAGSFFLLTSTALIIFGLSTGGNVFPWGSKIVMSSLIVGTLLWMVFIRVEKTAQAPIMPLKMVWSRPRNFLVGCNFLYMVATNSIIFNLPLYFQAVRLESATVAGGRLLIPSMATTLSAVSTGVIITYTGRLKPTLWLGTGLIIFGAILIATIGRDFSNLHYFFILIPLNLGIGFALPSTIMSMLAVSTQTDQAVATATLFLWRSLGCVLGVASGSLIVQNMLRIGLERYVDGSAWGRSRDEDAEVIEKVWKSVAALAELEERYRVQVQRAYEGALIGAFRWAVAAAVIGGAMVVAVKLPPLKGLDEYRKVEEEQQDLEDCEEDYAQVEGVEVGRGRN